MNPFERAFKQALERKIRRDISLLLQGTTMAKDYVGPTTPPRREPSQDPPQPRPVRRTLGFWSIPDAARAEANLNAATREIPTITDEEAAEFGVPPTVGEEIQRGLNEANRLYRELAVVPVAPRPEVAPAEDDSFTTERFGAEDGPEQNGIPAHPQFMPTAPAASMAATRPRMRRR